jgi:hypothetical protein
MDSDFKPYSHNAQHSNWQSNSYRYYWYNENTTDNGFETVRDVNKQKFVRLIKR